MCTAKKNSDVKKVIGWKRLEMLNEIPCSAYCSAYDFFLHSSIESFRYNIIFAFSSASKNYAT